VYAPMEPAAKQSTKSFARSEERPWSRPAATRCTTGIHVPKPYTPISNAIRLTSRFLSTAHVVLLACWSIFGDGCAPAIFPTLSAVSSAGDSLENSCGCGGGGVSAIEANINSTKLQPPRTRKI